MHADATPEGGRAVMQRLLARRRPTAVFCYDDLTALGALAAARSVDVSVPGDLSVVGFDDLFVSSYPPPPLTTIRHPMTTLVRRAAAILLSPLRRAVAHNTSNSHA